MLTSKTISHQKLGVEDFSEQNTLRHHFWWFNECIKKNNVLHWMEHRLSPAQHQTCSSKSVVTYPHVSNRNRSGWAVVRNRKHQKLLFIITDWICIALGKNSSLSGHTTCKRLALFNYNHCNFLLYLSSYLLIRKFIEFVAFICYIEYVLDCLSDKRNNLKI